MIDRCPEAEVPRLFGLAKSVFADAPGWNDARVLGALSRDLLFLAKEGGEPAGYVANEPIDRPHFTRPAGRSGRGRIAPVSRKSRQALSPEAQADD